MLSGRVLATLLLLTNVGLAQTLPLPYPEARRGDQVDDYHGTSIADPYRWLEDPDSPESRKWIDAENVLTNAWLEKIPARVSIRKRLTELWDYERQTVPEEAGGTYFLTKNSGLQNQGVLYKSAGLHGKPEVLLDPNLLSTDGTVALSGTAISEDGKWLAYGLSKAGSDWQTWKVREIDTTQDLPETLEWVKFSDAAWTRDGAGFYYSRYEKPADADSLRAQNFNQKLYFHQRGTPQANDLLVYERPDHKDWIFDSHVTEDGKYLIITVSEGTDPKNRIFYRDLSQPDQAVVELLPLKDAEYSFLGNLGTVFYFRTDLQAPQGRIVSIDTAQPLPAKPLTLVPENADKLDGANVIGGKIVASYLHDAHSRVALFTMSGDSAGEITLPGIGSADGFNGRQADHETFYSFTSFNQPSTIYRYDFVSEKSELVFAPKLAFDPKDYVTEQVFYPSLDGTRIPMFITSRKGLRRDGLNPVYLYGYGGFDVSLTPSFSSANLLWMELGGVYAVANLRGGGEYGEKWHLAGAKNQKQNVFDDFIAAAQYLIDQKVTSTRKLAIGGRSNGGLLVGAALTQRPDLFGAALPVVGVLDMLRFQKFTIGWAWTSDYGSSDKAEDFPYLAAYSPLHHIHAGVSYPATLVMTGDHDDRVVPAHSFKFAATLQAAQAGPAPLLIRIDTQSGHGAGKPTAKTIEEISDGWAFLTKALDMTVPTFSPSVSPTLRELSPATGR